MTDLIGRTLNRLRQQLHGRLSMPGDERYAAAIAKPSDLPVQGPTKFEITINLKTAKRSANVRFTPKSGHSSARP
jgi:hypothetical protein